MKAEEIAYDFKDNSIDPRQLNARYDALKNGRYIEKVTDILPSGLYRYKREGTESRDIEYVPAQVSSNPLIALNEAGQTLIQITLVYDQIRNLWSATCDFDNGAHFSTADHSDRNEALARAVMSAVCLKIAFAGDEDE